MKVGLADLLFALARGPRTLEGYTRTRRHRRIMRDARRFSIDNMPESTVGKITGRVRPLAKTLLEAPLSGRLCVYYEACVDVMMGATRLRTIVVEQEGMRFQLDDGTGRAQIDPAHARISTGIDSITRSTLKLQSERQRELLVRHHIDQLRVPSADSLRYREAILECDEMVAVVGGGIRERDLEATPDNYRDNMATRLCFYGTEKYPLYISDDPRSL
jgi:hypothetical protein